MTIYTAAQVEGPAANLESFYGFTVSREVLAGVVNADADLQNEIATGGWPDTCAREKFLDAYTFEVTGAYWPTYGAGWSEARLEAFMDKLEAAAR